MVLATEGEHEPDRRASTSTRREPGPDGVQPGGSAIGAKRRGWRLSAATS